MRELRSTVGENLRRHLVTAVPSCTLSTASLSAAPFPATLAAPPGAPTTLTLALTSADKSTAVPSTASRANTSNPSCDSYPLPAATVCTTTVSTSPSSAATSFAFAAASNHAAGSAFARRNRTACNLL